MNITLLIISSILLLSIGFFYVIKGLKESDDDAVPISDINELKTFSKTGISQVKMPVNKMPLSAHMVKENTLRPASVANPTSVLRSEKKAFSMKDEMDSIKGQMDVRENDLNKKISLLEKEKDELSNALGRELKSMGVEDVNAKNAIKEKDAEIVRLGSLNRGLSEDINKLMKELDDIKKEYQSKGNSNVAELSELKVKISVLQGEADALNKRKAEFDSVKNERKAIEEQSQDKDKKIQSLEEKVLLLRQDLERDKYNSQEKCEKLKLENKTLVDHLEEIESSYKRLQVELAQAKEEQKVSLFDDASSLKNIMGDGADIEDLKRLTAHLLEKENVMQYELSKSKAQAMGLEKLCEEFKGQIENITKTI
jgi:chromosome segregation ATPase